MEFDIIANNGQINSALAETKRRVQGFTDATVEGGDRMEAAYREAAAQIEAAFKDIDTMAAIHSNAIADLEKEYARLGEAAGAAFMKGTAKGDEEYRALTAKQQAIKDEIAQRKALLQEVANTADALQKEEQTLNENKAKVEQNAKAKGMLRTQVMNLKNSLAEMEQNGKRNTDEYRAMQAELGRLADAMADANTQAKIMSDDYQNMNTVLEVMGGISGAFSAAKVVFIGPCAAKKLEAMQEELRNDVDFVLTYEELMGIFEAREIELSALPESEELHDGSGLGRGFAAAGGVAAAVEEILKKEHPELEVKTQRADGLRECRKLLMLAKAGRLDGYLLEGMACPGGCIAGAGTVISADTAKKKLTEHMKQADEQSCTDSPYSELAGKLD